MFLSASSRKKTPLIKYVKRTPALAANCRVAFQNSTSFEPSNASSTNCGGVGTLAMNYLPDRDRSTASRTYTSIEARTTQPQLEDLRAPGQPCTCPCSHSEVFTAR